MLLTFATTKLEKEFGDARALQRNRGKQQADKIQYRVSQLRGAVNLGQLRSPTPGHFHPLREDKDGLIACDLDGAYRLIFEPDQNPIPKLESGGLDWTQVIQVKILGVLNYHERNKSKPV
jgi:proteic killer suppression protein